MNVFSIAYLPFAKQDEAWREQMKGMREEMEAATEELTATIATAVTNQRSGMFDIYINIASKRVQRETQEKLAEMSKRAASEVSVWNNKPPPTTVEAGGLEIDLSANTIKMSDGTLIDITTGLKKVNLTV